MLLFSMKGISQEIPKGFEITEIVKMAEAYRQVPNISFDIYFTYADSAHDDVVLEELKGSYKIHNGNYWGMLDSIEYLQGNQYNLAIFHKDSTITINNRQEYTAVFQIPLLDSVFRESSVSGMQVVRINDSTRSLKILFKPEAYYRSYEIQYDLNTFLIRKVKYYLKDSESGDDPNSSGIVCVAFTFSNYSTESVGEAYFDESKFIRRYGDQIIAQPAFEGFKLITADAQ